jgi:recombination protein RecR
MVLHLLEREREGGKILSEALRLALDSVGQCQKCRIFSEDNLCSICKNEKRDKEVICVVESVADVFAIEQSNQFRGRYFILHGHLSPIDDIGPEQLGLNQLFLLVRSGEISEIILATNSTLEGEATAHFIYDALKDVENLDLTKLAQGVPLGGELEYVDRGTIMHAFSGRVNLKETI